MPIAKSCKALKMATATYYRWAKRGANGGGGPTREFYERVVLRRSRGGADEAELVAPEEAWRSVERFEEWASGLVLDSGEGWRPEPFQLAVVEDILAGFQAVWMVLPEANGKTTLMARRMADCLGPSVGGITPYETSRR